LWKNFATECIYKRLLPSGTISDYAAKRQLNNSIQIYEPTVFENYVHEITIDNQPVELSLWDTAGQEEFDRIRLLSYENTHVYMMCFSVENRDSLQNIPDKWLEEITENGPHAKIVLVALKCDLRQEKRNTIQYEEVGPKRLFY
jgi:Rho family protein